MSTGAAPAGDQQRSAVLKMMVLAVGLGIAAAAAASLFVELIDLGQQTVFETIPEALGLETLPWWVAAVLLLIGASGVALARRMPGGTGKGPLDRVPLRQPAARRAVDPAWRRSSPSSSGSSWVPRRP